MNVQPPKKLTLKNRVKQEAKDYNVTKYISKNLKHINKIGDEISDVLVGYNSDYFKKFKLTKAKTLAEKIMEDIFKLEGMLKENEYYELE